MLREKEPPLTAENLDGISTIEFWRGLKQDLEKVGGKMHIGQFFDFFDPDANPNALNGRGGKYSMLRLGYSFISGRPDDQRVARALISEFQPPLGEEEFLQTVSESRQLMAEKLWIPTKLKSADFVFTPKFWSDFGHDLSLLEENITFTQFLDSFDPENPTVIYRGFATGKYHHVESILWDLQYVVTNADETQAGSPAARRKARFEMFFQKAPENVQLQLCGKFPENFEDHAEEVVGRFLTEEATFVVETSKALRPDSQDLILDALTNYLSVKLPDSGFGALSQVEAKKLLQTASKFVEQTKSHRAKEVLSQSDPLVVFFKQADSDNQAVAAASKKVILSLVEGYYQPLVKSELYKAASSFWNLYLDKNPGAKTIPPTVFTQFLKIYTQQQIMPSEDVDKNLTDFFDAKVFPQIYQHFAEIANFAPQIAYFTTLDPEGNKKHLLLHQVEAIKQFVENGGHILADEPGTGKTLIFMLGALNLLDKKECSQEQPGRVLVVGSKTVIANVEQEIAKHLQSDRFDLVNINSVAEEELKGKTLNERIKVLRARLKACPKDKQVILVNYDIFRHPNFRRLLNEFPFAASLIDEAHNIKSRNIEAINLSKPLQEIGGVSIAKRIAVLYQFIKDHPEMTVSFATSTPFVKDLIEPLILAHLINPKLIPAELIAKIRYDPVETYKVLRKVMMRRRKDEISELPAKETKFIPIDLGSMSPEHQQSFKSAAEQAIKNADNSFSLFYSLLALEGQVKMPWLADKVKQLLAEGRKVVIFTPFVEGENRFTSPISTKAIAERLRALGVRPVGVLDGTLNDEQKLSIQNNFLGEGGLGVVVGNYQTAGESITLNSSKNRATEVILFIAPNAISRYIQAIDRIHRLGQREQVTVHIPYLVGDILGREKGTYDQRVIGHLMSELTMFEAVVDGLFFVESKDIYQSVARAAESVALGQVDFSTGFVTKTSRLKERKKGPLVLSEQQKQALAFFEQIDYGLFDQYLKTPSVTVDGANGENSVEEAFFRQISHFPLLTAQLEKLIFEYLDRGAAIADLVNDPTFMEVTPEKDRDKMRNAIAQSPNLQHLVANCNYLLVASIANKHRDMGLPLIDLIQEGSFGLLRAIDKFDVSRGTKFSTYVTHWIRQSIDRAIKDKSRLIRLPVHAEDRLSKTRKIAREFTVARGHEPNLEELEQLLAEKTKLSKGTINNALSIYYSQILTVASLDETFDEDDQDSKSVGDLISDPSESIEEIVTRESEHNALRTEIERAFAQHLNEKERDVLTLRFNLDGAGEKRTLEEVGRQLGITRERVRQLEGAGLGKLRGDEGLERQTRWWEKDQPGILYGGASAERVAFRLGLFPDEPSPSISSPTIADQLAGKLEINFRDIDWCKQVYKQAIQRPEVKQQLSPQQQSLLSMYLRSIGSSETTQLRLGLIFGITAKEVEDRAHQAIQKAALLLAQNIIINQKADDKEEEKPGRKRIVGNLVRDLRNCGFSNAQIIVLTGKSYSSITSSAAKLIKDGEIQPVRDGRTTQRRSAVEQNEELTNSLVSFVNQNPTLTYPQIAEALDVPLLRIVSVAAKLRKQGRIS
ncbi:sigma-70 family RNA polymerase sigma factor [Candidatus Daviesbacteria bacterium]|nr:sigma-70 family RNA polymerase sigma factor [Candidatus Daviesbacteria bacterium]